MDLIENARLLRQAVDALEFAAPVACVYDPLDYAWEPHRTYLERYGRGHRAVLLVGMNPGPFGMVQTGVPFGDVGMVRDWLGITGAVRQPARAHPKRPVAGFGCARGEVSGQRLWGWARDTFGTPERFFARFFVANYCPLAFMEASGRNLTPDKLPARERTPLFAACDRALVAVARCLAPEYVVGIGKFAAERAAHALPGGRVRIGCVPHPSPASPIANRGWAGQMTRALEEIGVRC
ncbi:MAG TPA: uracil-DNA glycosylase family protein [Gammaproteobacteria bacterium]|jgi:single-strand selective monofunctional uracil DNA glycosylase|nr:uracil-DNA glycosylase family protein [Gammaproteobacteria bacterium]